MVWQEVTTRKRHLLGEYLITQAEVDCGLTKHVVLPTPEGLTSVWVDRTQLKELGSKIADISLARQKLDESYFICRDFIKIGRKLNKLNLKKASDFELLKYFKTYAKAQYKHGFVMIYPHAIERFLTKLIVSRLSNQQAEALLFSPKESFAAAERRALLEIAAGKSKETLEEHTKKYSWLPVYNPDEPEFDESYFAQKLAEMRKGDPVNELNELEENRKKQEELFNSVIEKLNPNKEFIELFSLLREYIYLRTYRTDAMRQAYNLSKPLFAELARRMKLTENEVLHLIPQEIEMFLEKKTAPVHTEIIKRIGHFAIWTDGKEIEVFSSDEDIEKLRKKAFPDTQILKELKGKVASSGIAKGVVKLVFGTKDIYKIKEGDIIVSPMTSPDLTIALKKAGAIVTDEGGVTCHAAIISRELNVPCIVGTKQATKSLKDGDVVVVDANKGVVHKL